MADDQLKRAARALKALRTSVSTVINSVELEIQKEQPKLEAFEQAIALLDSKETELKHLDDRYQTLLDGAVSEEQFDQELASAIVIMEKLVISRNRAKRFIAKSTHHFPGTGQNQQQYRPPSVTSSEGRNQTVRLPKLEMQKFYGDFSMWQAFRGPFEAAIHNNESLGPTDKFSYLRGLLGGDAATSIRGLSLTEEHYNEAIRILTNRFGTESVIVSEHKNNLLQLPAVHSRDDIKGLKKLHDSCEVEVRSLTSLGVPQEQYGSFLVHILGGLLPSEMMLEFSRGRTCEDEDTEWEVSELLQFLKKEIVCLERVRAVTRPQSKPKEFKKFSEKPNFTPRQTNYTGKPTIPTVASLQVAVNDQNNANPQGDPSLCPFCESSDHHPLNCNLNIGERKKRLSEKRNCFICLRGKHPAMRCRYRYRSCGSCGRKHHQAICDSNTSNAPHQQAPLTGQSQNNSSTGSDTRPNSSTAVVSTHFTNNHQPEEILLQTARVRVIGPTGASLKTRIFFDSGSQASFITESLSRKLNLEIIGEKPINVHKFEGEAPVQTTRKIIQLQLQNANDPTQTCSIKAFEAGSICGAAFSVPSQELIGEMANRGLEVADYPSDGNNAEHPIDILIGSDCYWEIASGRTERLGKALVALETKFGWVVQGPTGVATVSAVESPSVAVNTVTITRTEVRPATLATEESLSRQIRSLWELDAMGIMDNGHVKSLEQDETLNHLEETISFVNGRYQVGFPWKTNKDQLGNNYVIAKKRTEGLLRKLRANTKLYLDYNDVIAEQLRVGIAEVVPQKEEIVSDPRIAVYYIPHQAVIREESETTKLRVVLDASSHASGIPSLNDCMNSGPSLVPDLFDLLIRFREHDIALTGDIEKAFHQIEIKPEDRDALRFLWVKDPSDSENRELQTYRLTRVPFGVTASPFLLSATIKHHARKYSQTHPLASKTLDQDLFVDDLLTGGTSVKETYDMAIDAAKIMSDAGMKLRKWKSNSIELKKLLGGEIEPENPNEALTKARSVKVLGLSWDKQKDSLYFDVSALLQFLLDNGNTKRFVLQAVARIFDPLGFLSPFTIRAKMLIQELWQKGLPWDESLPKDLSEKFTSWCGELPEMRHVQIPRFYTLDSPKDASTGTELHCFVDASEQAYATVVYIRYQDKHFNYRTTLIASKARVAPLKKLTLPRLELMGAVIGAKLTHRLLSQLKTKPARIAMWTDSMITLHWVRGTANKWKPFVANRVREIQEISDPINWNHCSGKTNPADLPTRGGKLADLISNPLWLHGPDFLLKGDAPTRSTEKVDNEIIEEELRPKSLAVTQVIGSNEPPRSPLFPLDIHSKLTRAYRVTAWIIRFTENAKTKTKITGPLTAEEISKAEKYWVGQTQQQFYTTEVSALKNGKPIANTSPLITLTPSLDKDGLMTVGSRIGSDNFSYREENLWILPSQSRLAQLLAIHHHQRLNHVGISDTLGEIREQYWIPRAREMVKRELNKCTRCKYFRAQPSAAVMAPLPPARTTPAQAFEVCGVDFCGPLYDRDGRKIYVALFTCAVTRAVHLEAVSDLTTGNFILSFRRFISRRGMVKTMFSDNAKTFKRAEADLALLWKNMKSPEVADFFSTRMISWRYIADRAAWWGGFWERLVGSVKVALRKVVGLARLTFEEIGTVLTEIEATINSRPITHTYQDASEPMPLTPAHFLVGRRLTVLPSRVFPRNEPQQVARADLTRRWQYRQTLMERFWSRWRRDYLLALRSAHHRTKCQPTRELEVGDVVLVEEAKIPRLMWKMGRVCETVKGRDGIIRSCVLKLPKGNTIRRPVQLLYLLEC